MPGNTREEILSGLGGLVNPHGVPAAPPPAFTPGPDPARAPFSGDPDQRLKELSDRESQLRAEIAERQAVLQDVLARKAKVQASLDRAEANSRGTPEKPTMYTPLPGGGITVVPRDLSEAPPPRGPVPQAFPRDISEAPLRRPK